MAKEILSVKNLKTYFHLASGTAKAVDGVSFSLNEGEILGIIGESGCGKSVTASSVIRLLPNKIGKIENGEINFMGTDIMGLNDKELLEFRGRDVATIFQDPMTSLDPVFKIKHQMVEIIMAHQKVTKQEALKMAIDALKEVGIPEPEKRIDSYPHELSGGMCQRVIIAMALTCSPKLIIADEPTTALDVTIQAQVLDLLKSLQEKNGTAILLITHDLGVIWKMCHNVMVMYAGCTVEQASAEELYAKNLHPYTWGLLDSMPSLSTQAKQKLATIQGSPPDLRLTGVGCNFCNRCRYATEICMKEVPMLEEVEPNHFVACHRQTGEHRLIRGEDGGK